MRNLSQFEFNSPPDANLSFSSIVIRETNGKDEIKAKSLARAKGVDADMSEELIKLSVVSVDGVAVVFPFPEFDEMTCPSRLFIASAWKQVNGRSDEMLKGFLASPKLMV